MLWNYLLVTLRSIRRNPLFTIINISGLAVGIACFLILFLLVRDELGFDRFTGSYKVEQTYRVFVRAQINGVSDTNSKTSAALGPALLESFPEVLAYTRIGYFGPRAFRHADKVFRSGSIYAVDSNFFSLYNLNFLEGNPLQALTQPHSLVLTATAARRIFGTEKPLGQILATESGQPFQVTGVVEDFPKNSHFRCDYLESMSSYTPNESWLNLWFTTYILLKEGSDPGVLEAKLQGLVVSRVGPEAEKVLGVPIKQFLEQGNTYGFFLQPFSDIYLHSRRTYGIDPNTEWGNVSVSDSIYIYMLSAIAIFILLLAVINFMNLATARSEVKAREVGVRKTFGSSRTSLMLLFTGEAVVTSFLAMVFALVLASLALPWFNDLINRELRLGLFQDPLMFPFLLTLVLVVGVSAGSYPAFYLSSFRPQLVLKGRASYAGRNSSLRRGLVIVQFGVSTCLLICTLVIKQQMDFIRNKNLGFNKDQLLSINNANVLGTKQEAFADAVRRGSQVQSVTRVSRMFGTGIPGTGYLFNKKVGSDPIGCQYVDVDYDFLRTFEVNLVAGRFFSRDFESDAKAVVVNEAAMRAFGAGEVLNKELISIDVQDQGSAYRIIGVVGDFNYESLRSEVRPLVMHLRPPRQASLLTIRVKGRNLPDAIRWVEENWKAFSSESMSFVFVDETINRLYETEVTIDKVSTLFFALAIFIASIGLFGLAAFITEQRTKEIGIRKVLGATSGQVIRLLSREFAGWVLIANLLAWPVAWFVMTRWLEDFAYRISLPWPMFAVAGLITMIISFGTVSLHTLRAAEANPVNSLKHE